MLPFHLHWYSYWKDYSASDCDWLRKYEDQTFGVGDTGYNLRLPLILRHSDTAKCIIVLRPITEGVCACAHAIHVLDHLAYNQLFILIISNLGIFRGHDNFSERNSLKSIENMKLLAWIIVIRTQHRLKKRRTTRPKQPIIKLWKIKYN